MHIPDGYLSPATYGSFYALMLPLWYWASRTLKKTLKARQVSYLALGASFSFVIMMFNIPIPGGSTGHAVGGALVAIAIGPWAALMAISITLIVQALIFGDGGITALAANCFTMAFVMPFSAYFVYKLIASGSGASSPRRVFAAGAAGHISLNMAALVTAIALGIQPLIAHKPDGTPLYAPYPLKLAVPIMALEHLVFFGVVEAVATALVIAYLARTEPSLLGLTPTLTSRDKATGNSKGLKRLLAWLAVLVLLTPLGLLASGAVWGEWGSAEIDSMLGYVPEGLKKLEGLWPALLPDYTVPGLESPFMVALTYILSAIIGVAGITGIAFLVSRFFSSAEKQP